MELDKMRTTFPIALVLLLNASHVMAQSNCEFFFQPSTGARQKLFNVELRPQAVQLLAEVEKLSGKSVLEYLCADSGGSVAASSFIASDGHPFIKVIRGRSENEDSIVHELFHLKLMLQGFPILTVCITPDQQTAELKQYTEMVRGDLDNAIHHWIFYPEVRQMGLRPQDKYESLGVVDQTTDWTDLTDFNRREGRILRFFRFSLEIPEPSILDNMRSWYTAKGWTEEMNIAQQMITLVKNSGTFTPQRVIAILKACMKKIDRRDFKIEIGRVYSQNRGAYSLTFAQIDVVPQIQMPLETKSSNSRYTLKRKRKPLK